MKNSKRHSKGLSMHGAYGLYECWWVNDAPIFGRLITIDGQVYFGEFNQKYACHGKGKETWDNGESYDGDWVEG